MNGILPLHKPKGMTSFDCVGKLRRLTKIKKIGHTGTLDPNVTGVLPICFGEATKIIPFLTHDTKTYIAEVCLGKATETEDADGAMIEEKQVQFPTSDHLDALLPTFTGELTQITPLYSAVKVKGKKLYEYARAGIPVEQPKRQITIYRINKIAEHPERNSFTIEVECSKGTYIRTLCVDIGKALHYPAHMGKLVRSATDGITLSEAWSFEQVEKLIETGEIAKKLLPIDRLLAHLPVWQVDAETAKRVLQGQKFPSPHIEEGGSPFRVMHNEKLLAIYGEHPSQFDTIKPVRVFNIHKV